jgi:hypothetical protein
MRTQLMVVVALAVATTASAGEGLFSFAFNEDDCVNVAATTPAWRTSAAKRQATEEFRKPTAAELNVGTGFEFAVWNDETIPCRNIRPKELVITDNADNVRARYPLAPSAAVKANAFGASGAFYTAVVRLQRAAVARAFGEDGRLHVITSDGRRTTTFARDDFAEAVDYETSTERTARQEKHDEDEIIAIAARLDKACEPGTNSSEAYVQLAAAIGAIDKSNLSRKKATELLQPYADCLTAQRGTVAEAEASTLLIKLEQR